MGLIDLHTHTSASDGDLNPKELVDLAINKKVRIIAITDHDSVAGIEESQRYSKGKNIRVVPGVEISCEDEELVIKGLHIVGLFIDWKNKKLGEMLNRLKKARIAKKRGIIKKLNNYGYDISFGELKKEVGDSFGRPHIAKILIRKNYFSEIQDVFDKMIGEGKPAYIEQKCASMKEAIDTINAAGGIPILAHPAVYGLKKIEKIAEKFARLGGRGIEVDYPYDLRYLPNKEKAKKIIEEVRKIAKKCNLIVSGGSDFHVNSRKTLIGKRGINKKEFEIMKSKKNNKSKPLPTNPEFTQTVPVSSAPR